MGLSNAERQARWQQRRKRRFAEMQQRIAEMERGAPLRNERPVKGGPKAKDQETAQLKARIAELEVTQERLQAALHRKRDGISRKEYTNLLFCLHPDRVAFLNDAKLTARFTAARQTLQVHEKLLVDKNTERQERERYKREDERARRMARGEAEHLRNKARRDAARAKRAAERATSAKAETGSRNIRGWHEVEPGVFEKEIDGKPVRSAAFAPEFPSDEIASVLAGHEDYVSQPMHERHLKQWAQENGWTCKQGLWTKSIDGEPYSLYVGGAPAERMPDILADTERRERIRRKAAATRARKKAQLAT
jgi:hypothetical protein